MGEMQMTDATKSTVTTASAGSAAVTGSGADEQATEAQRLQVLGRLAVLDTEPEQAFDELTQLAAQLCGTPMALVSLVDRDRQWFKSHLGLELCETEREASFCARALGQAEPLVVPDTHRDPRFVNNPLVTGKPFIRSYAGAQLIVDGYALGTLCVLDTVPRELTQLQLNQLQLLAAQVVSQLQLRRHSEQLAQQFLARARVEAELRTQQALLTDLLAHTEVAVYVKDLDGRFLLANEATRQRTEPGTPGMLGLTDYDTFPELAADAFRDHDRLVRDTGETHVFTEELLHHTGELLRFRTTKFPLRDHTGTIYAIGGISVDVTAPEGQRRALVESEQRWRLLVENSPVPVAVIGGDGRFRYANPRALELYGVAFHDDLTAMLASEFVPAGQLQATRELFARVRSGETVTNYAWQLCRRDGTLVSVEVNAAAIHYGGAPAVQVELRDVSAQRSAEERIRQSEERFRTLFDQSPIGMAECLPDGTVVDVNERMCQMLGRTRAELVGTSSSALLADPADERQQRADIASLGENDCYFARRDYLHKDGHPLPVHVGVAVIRDAEGRVSRLLSTTTDITEQVNAERALTIAHDELRRRQILTDTVLDSIDVGIVACDENAQLTMFNRASQQWHGTGVDTEAARDSEHFGESFDLFDDDGTPLTPDRVPLLRALCNGSITGAEIVISPHGLPATRVQCSGRSMVDADGRLLGAVVAMTDITVARAQQQALQASEMRFRATFDNDPAGLAVLTSQGRIVQVNRAFAAIVGMAEPRVYELPSVTGLLRPEDQADFADMLGQALRHAGEPVTAERQLVTANGTPVWCLLSVTDLPDPELGRSILLQAEDITLRKQAEQRLTRQAMYDSLTDLPNRVMLLDRIQTAIARLQRRGSTLLYAMFCDIDGFKAINDTHGHAAGDQVLIEIGRRLRATVRPADTVARMGGDEFVVLCEDVEAAEDIAAVAARIEAAVCQPVYWNGHPLSVTTSIGIARGDSATTPEDLIRHADTAMYQAKRLGKDRYEMFDEDLRARSTSRLRIETAIRRALSDGTVEAHYQPVVELSDERIVGLEALARIRMPDGSLLMPNDFIPVAEDSGLIVPLGTQMLTAACDQVAQWRTNTGTPLELAVNLSARQAARPDLDAVVLRALGSAGLPPEALRLELTESVLLEAARSTLNTLEALRDAGVQIGIDDFGTGYASLRYLRQLPVSFLKVDREFVSRMTTSRDDAVIVHTVMRLAADLDLRCVVEGIETREQLALLDRNAASGQGYLFGRPVDATQTTGMLARRVPR
jgi:diguanylate cyclase (GGDEF)-like protein/PAS domain S-box-containing protein